MSTQTEQVARGVAWLDVNHPNWRVKVDSGTLNISQPDSCMLGQLGIDFSDFYYDPRTPDPVKLGFTCDVYGSASEGCTCDGLTELWKQVLTA